MVNAIVTSTLEKQFLDCAICVIEIMKKEFPECHETEDVYIYLTGVVRNNDAMVRNAIDEWFKFLENELDNKTAKYAKAVNRITSEPAKMYQSLAYRDVDVLKSKVTTDWAKRINMFEKCRDERLSEETRDSAWKMVQKMADISYELKDKRPPRVPSREEISTNISTYRGSTSVENDSSIKTAFATSLASLCRAWDVKVDVDELHMDDLMRDWNYFLKSSDNGDAMSDMCTKRDSRVPELFHDRFPQFDAPTVWSDDMWKQFDTTNSCVTVLNTIPQKMMSTIENLASKLADQIANGDASLNNLNVEEIGKHVLSQCNEGDMQSFSDNMDNILPALQNLAQSQR